MVNYKSSLFARLRRISSTHVTRNPLLPNAVMLGEMHECGHVFTNTQSDHRRSSYRGCQGLRPTCAHHSMLCTQVGHLPILIKTSCRSSSQNVLHRPDSMQMDWAAFQACLADRLPEFRCTRRGGNRQVR
jgi:hypothetical protein